MAGEKKLFDLIPTGADWNSTAEEKKLELRLGLPGEEEGWSPSQEKGKKLPLEASLSLGHVSKAPRSNNLSASSATQREGILILFFFSLSLFSNTEQFVRILLLL